MEWRIFDRRGQEIAIVDGLGGVMPTPHELTAPLPSIGLTRGDVIISSGTMYRIEADSYARFDSREKLHALRAALGGRSWVRETVPRVTRTDLPLPVRLDGGRTWNWAERRSHREIGELLYDARRWGVYTVLQLAVVKLGRTGRVTEQITAASDAAAIDALLSGVAGSISVLKEGT